MVNFKDFEGFGKGWPAERKAVEAGTYQDTPTLFAVL
jgi:hypothetical protein